MCKVKFCIVISTLIIVYCPTYVNKKCWITNKLSFLLFWTKHNRHLQFLKIIFRWIKNKKINWGKWKQRPLIKNNREINQATPHDAY
jgi:hypothetical protein